ncbi:MAG TPA: amino acid adenylation domain-containing protein [Thermoanaerobaculia bacterium]|nr:amino acid adenylation domain-containing protein [Thermoanaerobaculia bacterium]
MSGIYADVMTEIPAVGALPSPPWGEPEPAPEQLCLHELIATHAAAAPGALAVAASGEELSFGRLDRLANGLALRLRMLGVGPEVPVALLLDRSPAALVALLGVLKAGGAYVAIDPAYPAERIAWLVADSGAQVAVTSAALATGMPAGPRVLLVEAAEESAARPKGRVSPEHPIYVLYTSGSSGLPKGVIVRHGGVVNLARALRHTVYEGMPEALRVGVNASFTFDASVKQIVQLAWGHSLHLVPEEVRLDPPALVDYVRQHRLDVLDCTPTQLRPLLAAGLGEAGTGPALVLVGGEVVSPALREAALARPGTRFWNVYGPTECTVDATAAPFSVTGPASRIGWPLPGVSLHTAPSLENQAAGESAGELLVGGAGLARGYLGRPDLTAAQFVPDPSGTTPGARLYRTGDRARWLPDGSLDYLGRLDRQLKLRGFRIEPVEIESVLATHPAVRECAVVAVDDRLVAFWVAASPETGEDAPLAAELREHLRSRLPEPMVPPAYVRLAQLPATVNGKIDRRVLAGMAPAPEPSGELAALGTPIEKTVGEIWAGVLGHAEIGVTDDFFAVGGHSLLAGQVVARVREAFGVHVPLRKLFEQPTVAGFARAIAHAVATGKPPADGEAPATPRSADAGLVLSFAQERLWFLDRLQGASPVYNVPAAVRLTGELNPAALESAFQEIVLRHEVLRTHYAEVEGRPVGLLAPPAGRLLAWVGLEALPAAVRAEEGRALAALEAATPFDLETGPLLRVTVVRLGKGEHLLLLTMHHIVSDGWSMGVLIRELAALYGAAVAGAPSPLAKLPMQYADYAARQRDRLADALAGQLSWWRQRLAGMPEAIDLPADRPQVEKRTGRGGILATRFTPELTAGALQLSRRSGATLFMTLLAAFQALLARYSGGGEAPVGTPVAGRTQVAAEALIGCFVNTLVLRTDLSGDPVFTEVLRRALETTLDAYDHQDVPFEKLVEELAPRRQLGRSPLFQVMIALQNVPLSPLVLPGLGLEPLELEVVAAKFDLSLTLMEEGEELAVWLEYDRDLFDPATASRIAEHFHTLLAGAVERPSLCLSDLPLLTAAETGQLSLWSRGDAIGETGGRGAAALVHELFERMAERSPGALALMAGGERLSYGELEERSNRLARYLRRLGVGPEVPVALCLPRSAEGIVAILAILKAGGTYVPLDPAYPRQRLAWMLDDSRARVIVTREDLTLPFPAGRGVAVVYLDSDAPIIARGGAERPTGWALPESLAYVIYTSGSTGVPKGVGVSHAAAAGHLRTFAQLYGFQETDRALQSAAWSFDMSIEQILAILAAGAAVVMHDGEPAPGSLLRQLVDFQVTVLDVTPAVLHHLARECTGRRVPDLALRLAAAGGETMPPEVVRLWPSTPMAGSRLVNVYGPTEAVVTSTFFEISASSPLPSASGVPIGRPLAGRYAYVIDRRALCVPSWVPGELALGGVLARGYLGRPDATAERFVPDPWSGIPGARLYRTGDRARWLPTGDLEFLGRVDQQVKIRGFRIEPGEIETVLAGHPLLSMAAVVVEGNGEGRRLVAFVVPERDAAKPSAAELRSFLSQTLPEHMIPAAFVELASLPLAPNGKVDRQSLAGMAPSPSAKSAYVAPQTATEAALAAIWAEVLEIEKVGTADGFFDLGGHSLLATQVMSRVRRELGIELPLRRLFEYPTVAGLAVVVEEARRELTLAGGDAPQAEPAAEPAPPLVPRPRGIEPPLSFSQERLWFLDRLEPGSAVYNLPAVLRLEGEAGSRIDVAILDASLREVVRRHEVLRTVFPEVAGRPVQRVGPVPDTVLPVVDLGALPTALHDEECRRLAREEGGMPFDLACGPLLRARLLELGESRAVLLLTQHHAVSDGWSAGVLVREVAALHEALANGRPSPLPELSIQYTDFAAWQRRWLAGPVLESELAHWRQRLAGAPFELSLPTDRPRPAVRSGRGGARPLELAPSFLHELVALGRRAGATLFMTLLAGFEVLLSRYSGEDDFLVGMPIANRNRLETEGLIGFFVNTLVLRSSLEGEPSFAGLLARVRAVTLDAYAHQDLPFEKLVEELQPRRDLARTPLFQVTFILQNTPVEELRLSGLRLRPVEAGPEGSGTAKFDLTLALGEEEGRLRGSLEYDSDLFEAATASRMVSHLAALLGGMVANPGCRTGDLPLLGAAEAHQLAREWSEPPAAPAGPCLHELVAAWAAATPESPAVVCAGEELTYGRLDRLANGLALRLRTLGVGPEVRVALLLDRSVAAVVAVLGVLKAGGAYVPIDSSYPQERISWLLADSGAPVVVTSAGLAGRVPEDVRSVLVEETRESAAGSAGGSGPDHAAYVIYTSGSTGRPKGVVVRHGAVVNLARALRETVYEGEAGPLRVSLNASISFDASVQQLVQLAWGHCVHVLTTDVRLDPAALVNYVRRHRLDVLDCTPSQLRTLLAAGLGAGEAAEDAFPARVLVGGEAVDAELRDAALSRPRTRFWNVYGPTECTVDDTAALLLPDVPASRVGRPLAHVAVHVVDRQGGLAPAGVPGELHIGGAGLARGYLGRPELTAERFVPDPFGGVAGDRLYRTGDLVRRLADGSLDYLGRIDQQMKIRGFRIEPGEIEGALAAHPAVANAAVVAREIAPGDLRLVAYVVLRPASTLAVFPGDFPGELRDYLRSRLPEPMVPGLWMALEALPLNVSGKLDRRALRSLPAGPGLQADLRGPGYTAPRTPQEELLAGIWAEVLGVERVGVHDDFFALGGHSLLATRVASRVRDVAGVELPIRRLFEMPTVESLAAELRARLASAAPEDLAPPPIVPVPRPLPAGMELPLSFAQERLWFLDRLEPGGSLYNMPAAVLLRGNLDVAAFGAAIGEVVRRHEALRTGFAEGRSGRPAQVISSWRPCPLPIVDLSALPAVERGAATRRLAHEEAARPFELAARQGDSPRMLRVVLLQMGAREHVLLATFHHIASDGWSTNVFLGELAALYSAFVARRPSPLPDLRIQYADFAVWQRQWLRGAALERQLGYWREVLSGAPAVLDLPVDRPRPSFRSSRGAHRSFLLPCGIAAEVSALARRRGVTPFALLLTAFQALLARWSGQEDVVVGSPVANRNRLETEPLIGFFVNTLVLRLDLSGDPGFDAALHRTREAVLGAGEHQDLPFEKLVEELAPVRDPRYTPLFQAMFALQNASAGEVQLPGLIAEPVEVESDTAKFDLLLTLADADEELRGFFEYAADLFDDATVERLGQRFATLLQGALADPARRLSELPLLPEAELRQVLLAWNETASAYPREATLPELFAVWVERTPDAEALHFDEEVLAYRELDERAGRLAGHLTSLGIGPGGLVGVCLDRSPGLIVALLGILKAGGAYLPLDPTYPAERLAWMLEDSGASAVVTLGAWVPLLVEVPVPLVRLDGDAERIASRSAGEPVRVSAEAPAYVMYTSGSTGRPKGTLIPHRGIVRLLFATDYVALGPAERLAHASNVSFDAATFEVWGALLHGACLVGIARDVALSPRELAAAVERQRISTLFLTTALFQQVVREVPEAFRSVRNLLFGGEACDPRWVREALEKGAPERLLHLYGPTESTTYATWQHVVTVPEGAASVPIGRPVANTTAYVLDRWLQAAALGARGELYLGGDGLAIGYLHRPELTADRFVPNPFPHSAAEAGSRLYRTGDLVRRSPDGSLDFLGRADQQVKIRGFRIEPGEVEAALAAHPAVAEAVVVVREAVPGDRRLVAYAAGEAAPAPRELRAFLAARLPEHMVPSVIVTLPSLPLTPNGKVDRRALPEPEMERSGEEWGAPRSPEEELLAGIWEEVLGIERVGIFDNFFELGGHSLLATQLVSRVREALGATLPLRALFESPTVAGLAEVLRLSGREEEIVPPVTRVPRDGLLPLSAAQERLWFLEQLEPGRSTYVMPSSLRLAGDLDAGVLRRALGEVVQRHETLRTTFHTTAGRPYQEIRPRLELLLPVVDLRELPAAGREAEAERLAVVTAHQPFDLVRGPLLRVSLLRLAAAEHVLLLQVHHVIADAWSLSVLFSELVALYEAFSRGEPSPLPELPVQYADFAAWQRGPAGQGLFDHQIDYWRRRLAGAPTVMELPTDRPRPLVRTFRGEGCSLALPPALTADLKALSRRSGATLFMTLLAGFDVLLSRLSGQEEVLVGSPIAGRNRSEVEGLIGCFLNTVVLRADLAGAPPFLDLLARVRETTLEAYAHQDLPFERLLEEMRPERDLSRTPLFQVFLNMVNVPQTKRRIPGLELSGGPGATAPSNFDLTLYAREQDDQLHLNLIYNVDLFDEARATEMLRQLEALLAQVVVEPERGIGSLSLVTGNAALLLPRPEEPLSPAWRGSVPALFAQHARRVPQRQAVADPQESWTYGELDARSNRLAHFLRGEGVEKGNVVAIYGHRSAPLVWAVLGALKAGAAFTILDPSYPPARQLQCLELAAPRALVQVAAAGPLPEELEAAARALPCRLVAGSRREMEAADPLSGQPEGDPGVEVGPDDLAYVSFTSGSTGVPKGVLGRHGPLTHFTPWQQEAFGLGEADRFTLLSGLAHDPLQRDMFTPFQLGATICIPDPLEIGVPGRMAEWMRRQEVTIAHLTPAMGQILTETVPGAPVVEVPSLRYAFLVGDVLTRLDVARLRRLAPRLTCVNFYGSTETQRAVGYHVVTDRPGESSREILPLGRGMRDVQLLVLGKDGRLAGIGEIGEIALRSPHLAAGYLGDPELTRQRFVPNPFGAGEPEDRLYRTGDLGRYRPDGEVEFVARADNQVKVRGFRIELGEIEATLARHPAVREAAVVARDDRSGGKRLAAYVVPRGAPAPPLPGFSELQDFLRQRLPEYMVPPVWMELVRLPVTPNGKLDRKGLPEPELARRDRGEEFVPPRGEVEQAIAEIWQDVLQVERVGSHDKFFQLGGHSLLLVRVHARLRERFGQELSMMDLFKYPDVSSLAQRLSRDTAAAAPALLEENRTEELEQGKARRRQRLERRREVGDVS